MAVARKYEAAAALSYIVNDIRVRVRLSAVASRNSACIDFKRLIVWKKPVRGLLPCPYICNKVNGVRAVCCSEPYSAKLSRIHNNSNVLCFGARVIGPELAKMIVDEWLGAEFIGGRHQRRVDIISDIEKRN